MPTSEGKVRRPWRGIPGNISERYVQRLRLKDFMGTLMDAEIPIAQELGLYKWDAWAKKRREDMCTRLH